MITLWIPTLFDAVAMDNNQSNQTASHVYLYQEKQNQEEQTGKLEPIHFNNWKFIPEDWVKVAGERDRKSIWGDSTKSSPTTLVK